MGRSITIRQEMDNSMISLQKKLKSWTNSLFNFEEGSKVKTKNKIFDKKENEKNMKRDEITNIESNINEMEISKPLSNYTKKEDQEKKKEETNISGIIGIKISDENNEEEKMGKYVDEKIIKEKIKSWVFGSKLMKIQLWLHKNAASYSSIDENERDEYEKEIIQGRTTISSMIESLFDMQLNTIDLSKFTSEELREVKKYFDGTREKELIEIEKKREKLAKFKNAAKAIIFLNKLKKKSENFIDNLEYREKKNNKNKIELNQQKFKALEEFASSELFIKYLKTGYIIKCIITDIISFFSNQFHWLCYFIMILDHMNHPSILSLFYPISIFLYAILEYPRPKKIYWYICLLYTVILISLKYIVQLELFKKLFETKSKLFNPYEDFIKNLNNYKIGFEIYDSTFSISFFNYIVYDSLVIIFLLLNNYLLLTKGLWKKREHEIENIYQAMERIASTKHLKIQSIEETKKFNIKWLYGNKSNKRGFTGLFIKGYSTGNSEKSRRENKEKKQIENQLKDELDRKERPSFYKKIKDLKNKFRASIKKHENENEIVDVQMKPIHLEYYNEINKTYFQRLFPKTRNEKPGNDYYASYTITMLFIIFYLILFYTNMNQDKTFNSVTVETNQFSSSMIIFLIIHVIFLFYDRVIYISQNRNNLSYDYVLYDKETCAPISEVQFNQIKSEMSLKYNYLKRDKFIIPNEYIEEIQDKYNIIYIQNEEFNFPLFQKYALHLIITIFSHGFIFFYLPMKGNINIRNTIFCVEGEECNDFTYNKTLIIFYCIYVIYLIGSGLQVKYGYYDLRRKSLLKSGVSSINRNIFLIYKAIPFLYEIKTAIDWTFTSTCLDYFQWNKFEGIYDSIYSTYCIMTAKNNQVVGEKVNKIMKIGLGGTLSFSLILLIVIPIFLFSSLNPTNELNTLLGATLKIDLSIIYQNLANKNYTLFENSKPESIKDFFPDVENEWTKYNYYKSVETKNFPHKQIQKVEFFQESDRNWGLAKPHILKLINILDDLLHHKNDEIQKVYIAMDYTFERLLPAEAKKASNRIDTIIYDIYNLDPNLNITQFDKIAKIKELLECNSNSTVTFQNLYSVPLRLTANINPRIITDEKFDFNFDVTLGFKGCVKEKNDDVNYLKSYFTLGKITNSGNNEGGLVFHLFSDKVSSAMSGYSVLTFYVSFILLAGNYVRNFFSGEAEKISLTELPNPEAIISLCEGVQVSRYSFDYEQEEKLYYILIELMRSPDYLKLLTETSIEQYEKRKELTIKEKNKVV